MTESNTPVSAQTKLAQSRTELLAAMGYEALSDEVDGANELTPLQEQQRTGPASPLTERLGHGPIGRWWRRSPLSSVVQLGQPMLESYARKHPARLIALGAGTGALLWVVKPWKLLSAATIASIIVKNVDVAGLIAKAVNKASTSQRS